MNILHYPPSFLEVLVPGQDPNIDIVAVHGLNVLNEEDFETAIWTSGDKLWLRDFLPKELPNARILLFSHRSRITPDGYSFNIVDMAWDLLSCLGDKREDPERPLLFICHGLGGRIVKQALNTANNVGYESDIFKSTYGVAFFGTPHKNANYLGMWQYNFPTARRYLLAPKHTILEGLRKDPPPRAENNTFSRYASEEGWKILSFYETVEYRRAGLIVDRKSATLRLPEELEKKIPITADHMNICKFDTAKNRDYESLVQPRICELANYATTTHLERLQDRAPESPPSTVGDDSHAASMPSDDGGSEWQSVTMGPSYEDPLLSGPILSDSDDPDVQEYRLSTVTPSPPAPISVPQPQPIPDSDIAPPPYDDFPPAYSENA
ncbi:hypothetical protein FQN54_009409 [Arachnomyces sp. PD_36]|nr:hypothetical protein FQN54_009409 [Arachnomyces sp. PD_36]